MGWNASLKESNEIQGLGLIHSLPKKVGRSHLIQDVKR
jgi:hypothetical protein